MKQKLSAKENHTKKEKKCTTCGYKEIIVSGIEGCPHCAICIRCGYMTAKCKCVEGE